MKEWWDVRYPQSLVVLALALVVAACGSDATYTQEELDAAVEDAVAEAVEDQSQSTASTEAPTATTVATTTTTTTTTAAPTTTEAPTTTTIQATEAGTRSNPISIGNSAEVGDFLVSVVDVNYDAADVVLAENRFNDPPEEGRQYVLVTMEFEYLGAESDDPFWSLSVAVVGGGGNTFDESDDCGVTPNGWTDIGEMFSGATAVATECISVESSQIEGATWMIEPLFGSDRVFFELP